MVVRNKVHRDISEDKYGIGQMELLEKFDELGFYRPQYNTYLFTNLRALLEDLVRIGAVVRHRGEQFPPTYELISGDWSALNKDVTKADSPEAYLRERYESKSFLLDWAKDHMGSDGTLRIADEIWEDNEDIFLEMEREGLISRPWKALYPRLMIIKKP